MNSSFFDIFYAKSYYFSPKKSFIFPNLKSCFSIGENGETNFNIIYIREKFRNLVRGVSVKEIKSIFRNCQELDSYSYLTGLSKISNSIRVKRILNADYLYGG